MTEMCDSISLLAEVCEMEEISKEIGRYFDIIDILTLGRTSKALRRVFFDQTTVLYSNGLRCISSGEAYMLKKFFRGDGRSPCPLKVVDVTFSCDWGRRGSTQPQELQLAQRALRFVTTLCDSLNCAGALVNLEVVRLRGLTELISSGAWQDSRREEAQQGPQSTVRSEEVVMYELQQLADSLLWRDDIRARLREVSLFTACHPFTDLRAHWGANYGLARLGVRDKYSYVFMNSWYPPEDSLEFRELADVYDWQSMTWQNMTFGDDRTSSSRTFNGPDLLQAMKNLSLCDGCEHHIALACYVSHVPRITVPPLQFSRLTSLNIGAIADIAFEIIAHEYLGAEWREYDELLVCGEIATYLAPLLKRENLPALIEADFSLDDKKYLRGQFDFFSSLVEDMMRKGIPEDNTIPRDHTLYHLERVSFGSTSTRTFEEFENEDENIWWEELAATYTKMSRERWASHVPHTDQRELGHRRLPTLFPNLTFVKFRSLGATFQGHFMTMLKSKPGSGGVELVQCYDCLMSPSVRRQSVWFFSDRYNSIQAAQLKVRVFKLAYTNAFVFASKYCTEKHSRSLAFDTVLQCKQLSDEDVNDEFISSSEGIILDNLQTLAGGLETEQRQSPDPVFVNGPLPKLEFIPPPRVTFGCHASNYGDRDVKPIWRCCREWSDLRELHIPIHALTYNCGFFFKEFVRAVPIDNESGTLRLVALNEVPQEYGSVCASETKPYLLLRTLVYVLRNPYSPYHIFRYIDVQFLNWQQWRAFTKRVRRNGEPIDIKRKMPCGSDPCPSMDNPYIRAVVGAAFFYLSLRRK